MVNTNRLHDLIAALAPIDGVSIGKRSDKTTWRIDFKPEATEQQKAAAQAALDAFDIDAPPDLSKIDTDTLNAALAQEGSVVRALAEIMFAEINKLRVKGGDPAYTKAQFVAALKGKMR